MADRGIELTGGGHQQPTPVETQATELPTVHSVTILSMDRLKRGSNVHSGYAGSTVPCCRSGLTESPNQSCLAEGRRCQLREMGDMVDHNRLLASQSTFGRYQP